MWTFPYLHLSGVTLIKCTRQQQQRQQQRSVIRFFKLVGVKSTDIYGRMTHQSGGNCRHRRHESWSITDYVTCWGPGTHQLACPELQNDHHGWNCILNGSQYAKNVWTKNMLFLWKLVCCRVHWSRATVQTNDACVTIVWLFLSTCVIKHLQFLLTFVRQLDDVIRSHQLYISERKLWLKKNIAKYNILSGSLLIIQSLIYVLFVCYFH